MSVSLSLGLACFLREESFTLLTDVGGGEASSSAAELSVTACFHLGTSALNWCRFLENKQVLSDQQLQRAAVLSLKTGQGNVRWQEGPQKDWKPGLLCLALVLQALRGAC